ncbi:MAG: peptidoglycan DD-metalloendopeptidase family protein [Bacteroidales bacterium]|nr:peptidoglycan DD-metalloendopeptidase family protein [Bacteroidales bacterium]
MVFINTNNLNLLFRGLILGICLSVLSLSSFGQDRQKLENEKAKLEREISSINAILKETKNTKKMSSSELAILKKKILSREKLISNISQQMSILDDEMHKTQSSINALKKEIELLKKDYAKMLSYAQKNRSSTDKILFIFSAKSYQQAYQRYVFFRQYADMQKTMMKTIEEKFSELDKKTSELSLKKQNQQTLLQQEEKNKKTLKTEEAQKQKNIKLLSKKESQLSKQIKEKEQKKRKLQQQIKAAIEAEVRKQTALAKKSGNKASDGANAKKSGADKYVMSATPEEVALSNSFIQNKGKLPWPCAKGVVTSSFGVHPHPEIKGIMMENDGIDIRTPQNETIRAIFDGVVSKVFLLPNGQQAIIIRHGEFLSVYAKITNVIVKVGDKVSTKQKIGTIFTDKENVSEFNFQIWKGNTKQNPSLWIR